MVTAQGVPEAEATSIVHTVLASPILEAARAVMGRSAGVEQAARLRRHLEGGAPLEIDGPLDDERFHREVWTAHRPAVLRGVADRWPTWTLEGLRETHGDRSIEVLAGRASTPRWWTRREALSRRMALGELIERMGGPASDDVYGVARNGVLADLPGLEADIGRLPGLAVDGDVHARLWIGPAGTLTPLHHDQSSAWLVQRIGTKRVWLASPLEPALLDHTDGVFNRVDPRSPAEGDLAEVRWREVVIEPGDAVFLPVGWWHQVLAESPSVSVSLGRFRWPNDVSWYAPGRHGAPAGMLPAEGA